MPIEQSWLAILDEEDLSFLKRFLLSSGSLKAIAESYGVSYPTVRARLDRLIAKVHASDNAKDCDPFERRLRVLLAEGVISATVARDLLASHRESQMEGRK